MMNRVMVVAIATILISYGALADCTSPVTYGHGKGFTAWIQFEPCSTSKDLAGAVDAALDSVRGALGLLIDLRRADGMSYEDSRKIAERFINNSNDWFQGQKLQPRGPWQYVNALVILVDARSKWPVQALATYLNHTDFSLIVGEPMPPPSDPAAEWKGGLAPDVVVDPAKASGGDPIREEGLKRLVDLIHKQQVQQRFEMEHMFHGK
jgi:hypothetical protein